MMDRRTTDCLITPGKGKKKQQHIIFTWILTALATDTSILVQNWQQMNMLASI